MRGAVKSGQRWHAASRTRPKHFAARVIRKDCAALSVRYVCAADLTTFILWRGETILRPNRTVIAGFESFRDPQLPPAVFRSFLPAFSRALRRLTA
jgi:hypothetical protein